MFLEHFGGIAVVFGENTAENSRNEHGGKAYRCRHAEAHAYGFAVFLPCLGSGIDNLYQCEYAQKRHGKFNDDEDALHGTEFVVERKVVYHHVGKPLGIVAQREKGGYDARRYHGPFERTSDNKTSRQEEGKHDYARINRTVSALGVVEILAQVLHQRRIGVSGGSVEFTEAERRHLSAFRTSRSATFYIGHHEGKKLRRAVAPAHNIAFGQAAGRTFGGAVVA